MENKVADITVLITTYNRPDYLDASLKSVFKQKVSPKKIIIINDCSTIEYPNVGDLDTRILYIKLDESQGANYARNYGVSLCCTKYVAFLDDDDIWKDNFLEEHMKKLGDYDLVLCGYEFMNKPNCFNLHSLNGSSIESFLKKGNPFCGMSGVTGKTEAIRLVGFDNELPNGQDWDLFIRMTKKNFQLHYIKKDLFFYRIGSHDGITSKAKKLKVEEVNKRYISADKHREWMGETNYKIRLAEQTLTWIHLKENKIAWVVKSFQEAGFYATAKVLYLKFVRKISK